jgi:TatD DNase family protein
LIDIGVNLTNTRFDKDRSEMLIRAQRANVRAIVVTGTSVEESKQAISLCQQYPEYLHSTVGIHPHDADNAAINFQEQLAVLANNKCVKAIGECGLDFNRNFSTVENQKRVFSEQVKLASELQLPLFLHQRDAFEPWFEILTPYFSKVPAMVSHCFTGNKKELEQCLAAGMYIGITGWLCDERRGQELRDIVSLIPLDRLMIETDAPYLTPRNIRPKPKSSRNEPSYLPYIIKTLAELMPFSEQDIIKQTTLNSENFFSISTSNV